MGDLDTRTRGRPRGNVVSLARRTVAVSVLLSVIIGTAFFLLALAIDALRGMEARANHSQEVLVAANRLERLVIDVEANQRGFVITGQPQFLVAWHQACSEFARQAPIMQRLASSGDAGQEVLAAQITRSGTSYIRDYSVPLIAAAQRNLDSARMAAVTEDGKRQVDAIRSKFDRLTDHEQQIFDVRQRRADATARWALGTASVGVAGSILLILFSGGDLTVRMPETGPGEVGSLERSFNNMTDSLAASRDQLRRVADEQAALRRVATLVARGISPPEVFTAVAGEAGRLLDAEATGVARFEPDGGAIVVGSWDSRGDRSPALPIGWRTAAEEDGVAGRVQRTGEPARVSNYDS